VQINANYIDNNNILTHHYRELSESP